MRNNFFVLFLFALTISLSAGTYAFAKCGHSMGGSAAPGDSHSQPSASSGHSGHSMMHSMANRPLQTQSVKGQKISLDIMDISMHMNMQKMKGVPLTEEFEMDKSHAIMLYVKDEKTGKEIGNAKISYVIQNEKDEKETGNLEWYKDHYGVGFKAFEKGNYKIIFLIKEGGVERNASFNFTNS